jgi:hypothetical protein
VPAPYFGEPLDLVIVLVTAVNVDDRQGLSALVRGYFVDGVKRFGLGHIDFHSTPESIATPSWVKARGVNLGSRCFWEAVTNCDRFMASTLRVTGET